MYWFVIDKASETTVLVLHSSSKASVCVKNIGEEFSIFRKRVTSGFLYCFVNIFADFFLNGFKLIFRRCLFLQN